MALILLIGISQHEVVAQSDNFILEIGSETQPKWLHDFNGRSFPLQEFQSVIAEFNLQAYSDGYVAFDGAFSDADSAVFKVNLNQQYQWSKLKTQNQSKDLIESTLGRKLRVQGDGFSPIQLLGMSEILLKKLENSGFPFAQVFLDSVVVENGEVSAVLNIQKGPLIRIDSVRMHGNLAVKQNFLTNYLNLKEGQAYHEGRVKQSQKRLEELSFATQVQPPQVTFVENSAFLDLYLNKRRANRFDGIVGFLPAADGSILITGDVKLHLENTLKQGELLDLSWRKLQTNTQDFNVMAIAPFVLNSPISIDGKLQIYRRDTLFANVDRQVGLRYMLGGADYLRLFFSRSTSSLLSTAPYENGLVLPPFLDKKMSAYGVGLRVRRLDYLQNPSRGFSLTGESSIGTKEISKNGRLPEVLYDSLELKTLQSSSSLDLSYFLSPLSRLVWHQRIMAAHLLNEQLFNNEAFRIGGFNSIRGFDEESIFATSFSILRSELRYQIDKDGYVFGFFDGAWYQNTSINRIGVRRDLPYSFGVGTSFGTTAGIFNLSYGMGSQRGNPILLRTAKIHFGYTSVF